MEEGSDGDSQIYAGFGYIGIILKQISLIKEASDEAYAYRGLYCLKWLNRLRQLYPLVKNQSDMNSTEEVDFDEIAVTENGFETKKIRVKKSEKYMKWFDQIETMIERNTQINQLPGVSLYSQANYKNDKKILSSLSACETELLTDANSRHLLMPEGRKDMKELVKKEWIDRAKKKEF